MALLLVRNPTPSNAQVGLSFQQDDIFAHAVSALEVLWSTSPNSPQATDRS